MLSSGGVIPSNRQEKKKNIKIVCGVSSRQCRVLYSLSFMKNKYTLLNASNLNFALSSTIIILLSRTPASQAFKCMINLLYRNLYKWNQRSSLQNMQLSHQKYKRVILQDQKGVCPLGAHPVVLPHHRFSKIHKDSFFLTVSSTNTVMSCQERKTRLAFHVNFCPCVCSQILTPLYSL